MECRPNKCFFFIKNIVVRIKLTYVLYSLKIEQIFCFIYDPKKKKTEVTKPPLETIKQYQPVVDGHWYSPAVLTTP